MSEASVFIVAVAVVIVVAILNGVPIAFRSQWNPDGGEAEFSTDDRRSKSKPKK